MCQSKMYQNVSARFLYIYHRAINSKKFSRPVWAKIRIKEANDIWCACLEIQIEQIKKLIGE